MEVLKMTTVSIEGGWLIYEGDSHLELSAEAHQS